VFISIAAKYNKALIVF